MPSLLLLGISCVAASLANSRPALTKPATPSPVIIHGKKHAKHAVESTFDWPQRSWHVRVTHTV